MVDTPKKVKEVADKIDDKLDEVTPAVGGFIRTNIKYIVIGAIVILVLGSVLVLSGVGA